jgi:hypothetical protein
LAPAFKAPEIFKGCAHSSGASLKKHGYFGKYFENPVIIVFNFKIMVILKKNSKFYFYIIHLTTDVLSSQILS